MSEHECLSAGTSEVQRETFVDRVKKDFPEMVEDLGRPKLPLELWLTWARRDDWHERFVGSDIRQMLGEIQRLREHFDNLPAQPQTSGMRHALERAQKIIERDYPNGQLAIDIRNALSGDEPKKSAGSAVEQHEDVTLQICFDKVVKERDQLRAALSEAHRALVAFKDAVIASDHMKGREYVGLGIQVNDAIDKARLLLSSEPPR